MSERVPISFYPEGPQGPQTYFGELKRSTYMPGGISIYGPTVSLQGEMTYGEVYLFAAPQPDTDVPGVVDYEWLTLHLGSRVRMQKLIPEGPDRAENFSFCIFNERSEVVEQVNFPQPSPV